MTSIRNALIAITLAFAVWETSDIPDAGAIAGGFAVLFFLCAVWLWKRSSRVAALVVGLQFMVEATQAHTWKDASTFAKAAGTVLGTAGILAVVAFLIRAAATEHRTPSSLDSRSVIEAPAGCTARSESAQRVQQSAWRVRGRRRWSWR